MGDYDRDREVERDRDGGRDHIRERETVIHTDRGDRYGGGRWLIPVLVLVALLALLFYLFGGNLNRAADEVGVNVDVEAPDVTVPNVEVPDVDMPDINVNIPEIEVKTNDGEGNSQ